MSGNNENGLVTNQGFSLPIKQGISFATGVVAIILLQIVGFIPLISLTGGLVSYLSMLLIIPRRKDASEITVLPGLNLESVQETLSKARVQTNDLRAIGLKISTIPSASVEDSERVVRKASAQVNNRAASKDIQNLLNKFNDSPTETSAEGLLVIRICDIAMAIINEVERVPNRINTANAFFEEHLPRVLKIAGEQNRLRQFSSVENAAVIARATQALLSAQKGFEMQLNALVESDQRALEYSADSLTKLLEIEHGYKVNTRETVEIKGTNL